MKAIAVDARPLTFPLSGIGRYTAELLYPLITETTHSVHWYLYSHARLTTDFSQFSNVTVRTSPMRGGLAGSIWSQFIFPLWAYRDGIELFWSPRHHLPLFFIRPVKRVVTIHDLVWVKSPETMSFFGRLQESLLMPRSIDIADRIFCVSEATRVDIQEQFESARDKVLKIPLAARLVEGVPVNPDAVPYFLFVGTQEPRKNLRRLLLAFKKILEETDFDCRLVIAGGDGWGGQDLKEFVAQDGIEDHVDLLGYVHDSILHTLYKNAFALLMPSLYEGFGLPLLESMQYGVPVITSNVSSMPEVAGSGGLLVDPYSVDDIVEKIKQLIDDPELYIQLSVSATEQASKFSWEVSARTTLDTFLTVLDEE